MNEFEQIEHEAKQQIEITKIKYALVSLWRGESNPEAQKIIDEFKEELDDGFEKDENE